MRHKFLLSAALAATALAASLANAGTLIPLAPVPGSTGVTLGGINDHNEISGFYRTSDNVYHGFVGDLNGNYTTFDPGPGRGLVHGLNNEGYVTGTAYAKSGDFIGEAFVRTPAGAIKFVTKDGEPIQGYADGIIAKTLFVGSIYQITDNVYQYGYYGKGHTYRADLVIPFNTYQTRPRGINKAGEVAGYYTDVDHEVNGSYPLSGFVLKDGVATRVVYPDPDSYYTYLDGLNNKGTIVGSWLNTEETAEQAFVYDFEKNRFKLINVPGDLYVSALGINSAGLVTVSSENGMYIYCPKPTAKCPSGARPSITVPDRWVSGDGYTQTVACKNGCIGPYHRNTSVRRDPEAIRTAIAHERRSHANR